MNRPGKLFITGGFSLVEMLVAMGLGVFLISGMIAVFSGNKRSSDLNTAMANIQENARFALNNLASDIRMSGFQGCIDINRGKPSLIANDLPTQDLHATAAMASIISAGNNWTPNPPLGFNPANHNPLPGTHALTLQFGSPATYPLAQAVSSDGIPNKTANIMVDTTPGISREEFSLDVDDFAIISNCVGSDLIRISSINKNGNTTEVGHSAPANESGALSFEYSNDANTKFMRFESRVYYVGNTGLTNEHGDPITALYQQSLPYDSPSTNPPTELIQGVENLRIAFGIRTGSESISYVLPSDPRYDPRLVESIRIGLLLNSYDRISQTEDTNTYIVAGQAIPASSTSSGALPGQHAKDKRFRLAFNTTVKVRNRRN